MKTNVPLLAVLVGGLGLRLCAPALAGQITATSSPGVAIPDNDLNGLAETIDLTTSISSISGVTVTLDISGGWNGDYYAYLRHADSSGTGFAVLLNRVGASAGAPYGAPDSGMVVTLNDFAAVNIHSAGAGGGVLTGTYQPDGRNISPLSDPGVLSATAPTALLSSFDGLDANGAWTLFVADVSPGDMGTLESWSLTVSGTGVPDGASTLLMLVGGCGLLLAGTKWAVS